MKKKVIKPFSVDEWKNGAKVETIDGKDVRILCTDLKSEHYPIVAAITCRNGEESILNFDANGRIYKKCESNDDLVIVEEVEEPKRWADNPEEIDFGWCVDEHSKIFRSGFYLNNERSFRAFATENQAKSALAMARISQLVAHDERYGGVVTDEEWKGNTRKYCIERFHDVVACSPHEGQWCFLAFHTAEQRELFLSENERLVKDYLMID